MIGAAVDARKARRLADLTLDNVPYAATVHLAHCTEILGAANKEGRHALAIGLVRQCVEALSLIETGMLTPETSAPLLQKWLDDKLSLGALRREHEKSAWGNYGAGLWQKPWAEFFGQFAKAVQPYAHYSPLLMGWQFAAPPDSSPRDGRMLIALGPKTYDPLKASRVTLLQCLLFWSLARIMVENKLSPGIPDLDLKRMGESLAESEFLSGGHATWSQEFLPHLWFTDGKKRFS